MKTKNTKTVNQQLRALRREKKQRECEIQRYIAQKSQDLEDMKNANFKLQVKLVMLEERFENAVSEVRNSVACLSNKVLEGHKYCEPMEIKYDSMGRRMTRAWSDIETKIKVKFFDRFLSGLFNKSI